jgi:arylsulfatase
MNRNAKAALALATLASFFSAVLTPYAAAQQVTGTPGSASATTTIDGKQIPPPPPKLEE